MRLLTSRLRELGEALDRGPLASAPQLAQMKLLGKTDGLFARFPGGGAEYRCHYDGGAGDARKLTAILYANEGWAPEHGGRSERAHASRPRIATANHDRASRPRIATAHRDRAP